MKRAWVAVAIVAVAALAVYGPWSVTEIAVAQTAATPAPAAQAQTQAQAQPEPMTARQALGVLDVASGQFRGSREDHLQIQRAVQVLLAVVVQQEAAAAAAYKAADAEVAIPGYYGDAVAVNPLAIKTLPQTKQEK